VSRQHSKIIHDPSDHSEFQLVDLQSRNGTFLNRQRVYGAVRLNHNDIVQLGPGGPEFRFELDPPPSMSAFMQSPFDAVSGIAMKPTRESWLPEAQNTARPVGRSTVERLLGDVFTRVKRDANHSLWIGVAALVLVALIGAGTWIYFERSHRQLQADLAAAQKQTQTGIAHVNAELQKQPVAVQQAQAAAEQAQREVERLEAELRRSNEQNDANHKALVQALEAQRKQAAALARALQAEQQKSAAPPQSQNTATPSQAAPASEQSAPTPAQSASTPVQSATREAPAPAAPADRDPSPRPANGSAPTPSAFDAGMAQVREMLDQGTVAAALDLAMKLVHMEPERWEGYSLAGQCAEKLNDYKQAADLFQRAAQKAPVDQKPALEERAQRMQNLSK